MARDLNEAWGWIERLIRRVDRLYSGAMLENSSITNGRMRFINGLLLLEQGSELRLIGILNGDGTFSWTGPWKFESSQGGEIAGDVILSGNFNLLGKFESDGIRIQDGKIYVGIGGVQIVIDGDTGTITAGDMVINPADGGSVSFPGGAMVQADPDGGIRIIQGDAVVNAGSVASLRKANVSVIAGPLGVDINASGLRLTVNTANVYMPGLPAKPSGATTLPVTVDATTGKLYAG